MIGQLVCEPNDCFQVARAPGRSLFTQLRQVLLLGLVYSPWDVQIGAELTGREAGK